MRVLTSTQQVLGCSGFRNLSLAIALLILSTTACPQIATATQAGLNEDQLAYLKRGEILLEIIHREKPGAAARVTILLHANADEAWNIIGYCNYELIYVRGLKECELLSGDRFQMKVRHRLRNSWYTPTLDYVFQASRKAGGTGKANLISGDLKVLEGLWTLFPGPDEETIIVAHEIRIQSRLPAPKWMVRRTLQNDLPDMMACIRGLARASGNDRHIQWDLERCPGDISGLAK